MRLSERSLGVVLARDINSDAAQHRLTGFRVLYRELRVENVKTVAGAGLNVPCPDQRLARFKNLLVCLGVLFCRLLTEDFVARFAQKVFQAHAHEFRSGFVGVNVSLVFGLDIHGGRRVLKESQEQGLGPTCLLSRGLYICDICQESEEQFLTVCPFLPDPVHVEDSVLAAGAPNAKLNLIDLARFARVRHSRTHGCLVVRVGERFDPGICAHLISGISESLEQPGRPLNLIGVRVPQINTGRCPVQQIH